MDNKDIALDDYYTAGQLKEKLGSECIYTVYKVNCNPFKYGRYTLYDKKKVDEIYELTTKITPISVVENMVRQYGVGIRRLKSLIKENGIRFLDDKSYYKFRINYIYTEDIEQIVELCKTDNSDIHPYDLYKLKVSKEVSKESLRETLHILNQFAKLRINKNKKTAKWLSQLYAILNKHLNRELYLVSESEIQWIIDIINKEYNVSKAVYIEFVKFVNYLYKEKDIVNKNTYAIDYAIKKSNKSNEPYTQKEFLNLWYFIFTSIENKNLINKALENRNCAMTWLYIALHYVTIWRNESIANIEFPDLELIGFNDGEDFLAWLKAGNSFSKEMGRVICDSINTKIKAFGSRASKNNSMLVFEIGNLMVRPIGLLISICEAHRRIVEKNNEDKISTKFNSHKYLITPRMRKTVEYQKLLGGGVEKALNGAFFSNRRANKSYMNYIQNKSEQDKQGIGYFISSIMRGHKLDEEMFAQVTQVYINRNTDNTIVDISLTLMERGTMGFAKYKLLSMVNSDFKYISDKEQTKLIKDLKIRNSEIEKINEILVQRKNYINNFINRFVKSPKQAHLILNQLAYGKSQSNHDGTKCLLRAMIHSIGEEKHKMDEIKDIVLNERNDCIRNNPVSCIGCPMLIQEYLFLYELNNRLITVLKRFETAKTKSDKIMYTNIVFTGYLPLLQEIQNELGPEEFNIYFDMIKIKDIVGYLKKNDMLQLT